MRFTAWLRGGVKLPAPGQRAVEEDAGPVVVYASDPVSPEELFVSLLNVNQRKAWDAPWEPWLGFGPHWECKKIPVRGSRGGRWSICLARHDLDRSYVRAVLYDAKDRPRCFHALTRRESGDGVNEARPFVAAIAFLTQLQADEEWVAVRAG